jgi:hypothetical protein
MTYLCREGRRAHDKAKHQINLETLKPIMGNIRKGECLKFIE